MYNDFRSDLKIIQPKSTSIDIILGIVFWAPKSWNSETTILITKNRGNLFGKPLNGSLGKLVIADAVTSVEKSLLAYHVTAPLMAVRVFAATESA